MVVKTVSGSVASWPATGNVTTRPLPVQNLRMRTVEATGEVKFQWEPHPDSDQDSYRVSRNYSRDVNYGQLNSKSRKLHSSLD